MFMLNGQQLNIDTPFVIGDTSYPANWLRLTSLEEKNAVGITEVPDPEPFDSRFFAQAGVYKQIEDLRPFFILQAKRTMAGFLRDTDWALLRKMDTGQEVPEKIAAIRSQARAEAERLVSAIMQAESVADLIPIVDNPQWPTLE
jgi:hypothetical protein